METPIVIEVEQQQVIGMLHVPDEGNAPFPAVLFLHGFRGQKTEHHGMFVKAARDLARHGIAALRIDFRGTGDSEGDFADMTHEGELTDAFAALKFLREHEAIDPSRIGLTGMSFGGALAAAVMGRDGHIASAVFWCPVAHPKALTEVRITPAAQEQLAKRHFVDMEGWAVGKAFIEQVVTFDPLKEVIQASTPIRILHGSEDVAVPPAETRAYEAVLKEAGTEVDVHMIHGAGHTFDALAWEEVLIHRTTEWHKRHLLG